MGLPFVVSGRDVDESLPPGIDPREGARELAERKVRAAVDELGPERPWILGSDTIVYLDTTLYGKAHDDEEARAFLRELSGRTHRVVTGLALYPGEGRDIVGTYDETAVRFAALSPEEIEWYLASGEWRGVAGAYRVQGRGACLIEGLEGSYSTVMGLPIRLLYSMLRSNGYVLASEGGNNG